MSQLVEVAKNLLCLGTAGMACILLPGDSWDLKAVYLSVELPDFRLSDVQLLDGFRSFAASSSSSWYCFGVSAWSLLSGIAWDIGLSISA